VDSAFFDKESWKSALKPAIRVFVYATMIYVPVYIISLILAYFIQIITGDITTASIVSGYFLSVFLLFGVIISIFKVMDEERPGEIQLDMT
jgi:hypothetical protein